MTLLERVIGDAFFAAELAGHPLAPRQEEIVRDVVLGMLADNLCEVLIPGGAPGERVDSRAALGTRRRGSTIEAWLAA